MAEGVIVPTQWWQVTDRLLHNGWSVSAVNGVWNRVRIYEHKLFFVRGESEKMPRITWYLASVITGVLYKEIVTEIHFVNFFPVDT